VLDKSLRNICQGASRRQQSAGAPGLIKRIGVPTAFGTDLPFGHPDPWAAMDVAVRRTTVNGYQLNKSERITPEAALNRFLGELAAPSGLN
jgi:predicted amidohydrolase YtcJ